MGASHDPRDRLCHSGGPRRRARLGPAIVTPADPGALEALAEHGICNADYGRVACYCSAYEWMTLDAYSAHVAAVLAPLVAAEVARAEHRVGHRLTPLERKLNAAWGIYRAAVREGLTVQPTALRDALLGQEASDERDA